jgi:hypothetical protein
MYKQGFDFIVIGETWFADICTQKFNPYNIRNYNSIFSSRNLGNGGGLAIYVRKKLNYKIKENRDNLFHKIKLETLINNKATNVIAYYRPPNYSNFNEFLDDIVHELESMLPVVIVGDMNINILIADSQTKRYLDVISSMGAQILNSNITREISQTQIDHIIVKNCEFFNDISTIHTSQSDHSMIVASAPISTSTKSIMSRKYTNFELARDSFAIDDGIYACNDSNWIHDKIVSAIKRAVDGATSNRKFVIKRSIGDLPWLNYRTLEMMKKCENLAHKINCLKKKSLPHNVLADKFSKTTATLQCLIAKNCANHYNRLFTNQDIRKTWKNINAIIGRDSINKDISIIINGEEIDEPFEVAENFSTYYYNINNSNDYNYDNLFIHNESNSISLFLHPTDCWEVVEVIKSMPNKYSIGPDGISMKAIKELCNEVASPITHLVNIILETAVYPSAFKKSIITPIFKSGSEQDPSSYRPIGVTDNLSKIVEKIIFNRFENFTISSNYTDPNQFGFKKNCGTELALIHLFYHILSSIDKGLLVLVIFLDCSKAFNSLPHFVIKEKLSHYGIRGVAFDLLDSYLSNRREAVKINDKFSSFRPNTSGVQQGSIAGPYLFNICMDDIKKLDIKSTIHRFADDICICLPCDKESFNDGIDQIKLDVSRIMEFHRTNGLMINANKSHAMLFGTLRPNIIYPSTLSIGNNNIDFVNEQRHLGCILDNKLKMDSHIELLLSKINSVAGLIAKLRNILPRDALLHIYFAHVHSHLMFMVTLYAHGSSSQVIRLQSLQNRILKLIFKLDQRFHTLDLFSDVVPAILPIYGLLFLSTVSYVHKMKAGLVDVNIPMETNARQSRYFGDIITTSFKTNSGKRSITYFGYKLFNRLPNNLKAQMSHQTFKSRVKKYLHTKIGSILSCTTSMQLLEI